MMQVSVLLLPVCSKSDLCSENLCTKLCHLIQPWLTLSTEGINIIGVAILDAWRVRRYGWGANTLWACMHERYHTNWVLKFWWFFCQAWFVPENGCVQSTQYEHSFGIESCFGFWICLDLICAAAAAVLNQWLAPWQWCCCCVMRVDGCTK